MAIQEITETELVQRCAKCDGENLVPLAGIEVGIERANRSRTASWRSRMPDVPLAGVPASLAGRGARASRGRQLRGTCIGCWSMSCTPSW